MTSEGLEEKEERQINGLVSPFLKGASEVDHVPTPLAVSGGGGGGDDETVVPPRAVRPDCDCGGARDAALPSVGPARRAAVDPR